MKHELYRSVDDRVIAGVCAGLARAFDLNVTGVRWGTAILSLFSGLPVFVYIALWLVLKNEPSDGVIDV